MELLDLYDDNGKLLNETIIRGEYLSSGKNVMLAVVYIQNEKGEYLIQKTAKEKGSLFSTTGGHVTHNENALTTIVREVKEELGLEIRKEKFQYICTFKYQAKPCIFTVYFLKSSIDIEKIKVQKEEVESVCWMKEEEIENLIKDNKFLQSHAYIYNKYIKEKSV